MIVRELERSRNMKDQRYFNRDPLQDRRDLSMLIIPFEQLGKIDFTAQAVDVCDGGIGISTNRALDPGFVVIRNGLAELKSGVLLWSKELEDKTYRAGIQYIPLLGEKNQTTDSTRPVSDDAETDRKHRRATPVFMNTTRGIMVTDSDGMVQSVNDAFVKITGYSAADVVGKPPLLYTSEAQDDVFHAEMQKALRDQGMWSGIYWCRRKNGEVYPQEITINAIRNDLGEIVQYLRIFSDITEHPQGEESSMKSNASILQGLTADSPSKHSEISIPASFISHANLFMNKLSGIESRTHLSNYDDAALQNEMDQAFEEMSNACEQYEKLFAHDSDAIAAARISFRELTHEYFASSYFMMRARTWPQGYPGDYQTLEGVYRNTPLSSNKLGRMMDVHFLNHTLARAVRERIVTLSELIRESLQNHMNPSILNIACGSCRELPGLAKSIMGVNGNITCVDHDDAAIDFSMRRMIGTDLDLQHSNFRKYNALKMVNYDRNIREFGHQNIIYSAGFFDYLDDDTLVRMLSALYRMLKPGGTLIAPFKDSNKYRTQEYHWMVDWTGFKQRKPEYFMELMERAGIHQQKCEISRDKTGVIIFIVASK